MLSETDLSNQMHAQSNSSLFTTKNGHDSRTSYVNSESMEQYSPDAEDSPILLTAKQTSKKLAEDMEEFEDFEVGHNAIGGGQIANPAYDNQSYQRKEITLKNVDICQPFSPHDNLILREIENVLSGSTKIVEDEEDSDQ